MHYESIGIVLLRLAHRRCGLPLYMATVVGEMAYAENSTGNAGTPPPPRHLQTAVHLGIRMYALHQLRRGSIYFVFEMMPIKP